MLNRRYVHRDAGRVAAPLVALVSLLAGAAESHLIAGSPPLVVNCILWGLIGLGAGYLIFASEGPQQRPPSTFQAAVADGVVACLVTATAGTAIDLIAASGAGSSSAGSISGLEVVIAGAAVLVGGAIAGAATGAAAVVVGGRTRFERIPPSRRKHPAERSAHRSTKKRSKSRKR